MTRQAMLVEISRLDAEVEKLQRYESKCCKLKKKYKRITEQLNGLNIMISKLLGEV